MISLSDEIMTKILVYFNAEEMFYIFKEVLKKLEEGVQYEI